MKVIKTDSKKRSPKKSSSRKNKSLDNYKKFLGNNNTVTKDPVTKDPVTKDKKVIHVKRKKSSPRISRSNDIRDINDIEQKMIQMKKNKIQVPTQNVVTPPVAKPVPKPVPKPVKFSIEKPKPTKPIRQVTKVRISDIDVSEKRIDNKSVPKSVPKSIPKSVPKSIPKSVRKTHKSNKRSNHRSKSKPTRKVSVKTLSLDEDKIKKVESRMKEIRGKKTDEIRKELEKQGLKVSGKSNQLLRDIYLYSQVCNINIQHEK
jgi:hypothetical protein